MNSIRFACASILIAATLTPSLAHAKDSDDAQAIRQVLAQYEHAINTADTNTIAQLYTADGVQMAPDAPAAVGRDSVAAAYVGTFKAISLNLKFTVDEIKVLSKTSALLRSHSMGTLKINGTDQPAGPAAFKELFILNKQANGQWKFSHYSFSTAPLAKR
ncbi:conserved hypothetical protein [Formivibrio citricus]|uniref:DUF4440 domain-containing protein n=1 Tax=Formivibrio citricus TaxID=83765 RepID=A0A1I5B410_9NEIS|nr:SgcJ/EcaC family oxidoreductase [Formivibrio citricus]SFN69249.1 conserved hypothetical protein [Formivibrio citricus]